MVVAKADRLGAVTSPTGPLAELAQAYGVMTEYADWRGRPVQVTADTIEAVLAAMGVDTSDAERARQQKEHEPWLRMLPPTVVAVAGQTAWVPVHVSDGDPVEVWVELEDGSARRADQVDHWVEPREVDGSRIGEATFAVPTDLPLGYHRLKARSGDTEASAHLIVSPAWLGLPEQADRRRQWGFATQLYSVRSGGSWGLGDLTDLTDLAVWSASELGADFVLVNPLHAAEPLAPLEPSPYLPSSRRFFNPIYLRVERIPEYAALPQPERDAVDQLVGQLPPWLTPQDPIDRDASWTAKRAALRIVHAAPRSAGRRARLRGLPEAGGRRAHRLRHLERARRGPRQRRPRVAGRVPPPRQPRRRRPSRATTRTGWTSSAGCSGCSTSSSSRPRPRPRAPG